MPAHCVDVYENESVTWVHASHCKRVTKVSRAKVRLNGALAILSVLKGGVDRDALFPHSAIF